MKKNLHPGSTMNLGILNLNQSITITYLPTYPH